jgi:hypothetical protein
VRRHARLVDYQIHEGCNARAWLQVETKEDTPELDPANVVFITDCSVAPFGNRRVLAPSDLEDLSLSEYEGFEPMAKEPFRFYAAHSKIDFYTWGNHECCLPKGATSATLTGHLEALKVGEVLIFEEILGPRTGSEADADPAHRHAIRLTRVEPDLDHLFKQPVTEIEWDVEDALPFPLCLSAIGPAPACKPLESISVARGNVILVDHGRRLEQDEALGAVPVATTRQTCQAENRPSDVFQTAGRFRPRFQGGPLTFSQPLPKHTSASAVFAQDPRKALPQILKLESALSGKSPVGWMSRPDLLASHATDFHFTVEIDDDGHANLRFGDGDLGRTPDAGASFTANYRVGNGPSGNVGEGTITHLVMRKDRVDGLDLTIRNPMPARGGTAQEAMDDIKLLAPQAFRTQLQRAITAADYSRITERNPKVQRAAASLRWNGNCAVVQVAIDPIGSENAAPHLLKEIAASLRSVQRIGHDVEVLSATYVAIDLEMTICVLPGYLRSHVEKAQLDVLRDYFNPNNLTFGDSIYLSRLVAIAQAVTGVQSVKVEKLERLFEGANQEIQNGVLLISSLEVARLDNDPNRPENGRLKLNMAGGR